jgi:hypothetical protein
VLLNLLTGRRVYATDTHVREIASILSTRNGSLSLFRLFAKVSPLLFSLFARCRCVVTIRSLVVISGVWRSASTALVVYA